MLRKLGALVFTTAIALSAAVLPAQDKVFEEKDGLIVIEAESIPMTSGWAVRTSTGGFAGPGYIQWEGGDDFNAPPNGALLEYKVWVNNPGSYQFRFRSRKDGAASDAQNDTWVSVNGSNWLKVFVTGSQGVWSFDAIGEPNHGTFLNPTRYNLVAGENTIRLGGRSRLHKIDRIHMWTSAVSDSFARNPSLPESPLYNPGPDPGVVNFRNGNLNSFDLFSFPQGAIRFEALTEGLRMSAPNATTTSFGLASGMLGDFKMNAGETYEVGFVMTSTVLGDRAPAMPAWRMRINDQTFQFSQMQNFESLGSNGTMPLAGQERLYTMMYTVPAGITDSSPIVSFDYIFDPATGNAGDIGITIAEIRFAKVP